MLEEHFDSTLQLLLPLFHYKQGFSNFHHLSRYTFGNSQNQSRAEVNMTLEINLNIKFLQIKNNVHTTYRQRNCMTSLSSG